MALLDYRNPLPDDDDAARRRKTLDRWDFWIVVGVVGMLLLIAILFGCLRLFVNALSPQLGP